MSPRVEKLFKAGKKDKLFVDKLFSADGDSPPGMFASDLDKAIFSSVYYGYLIAVKGDAWEKYV